MLFNSIGFALFLPIVLVLYWFDTKRNRQKQNGLLLVASYYFYSCWDYRFLFLLLFSTGLNYGIGLVMRTDETRKKQWFWLSIGLNVGLLCVFKYYNFFVLSFIDGLALLGVQVDAWTLHIGLPIGISFYTFHGLSYIIDVYGGRVAPVKNFIDYAVFTSFFPLLLAGPIERATHLLPQIQQKRTFDRAKIVDGLRQILWGLFKKMAVADSCAYHVNTIFDNAADYSGSTLAVAKTESE